MPSRLAIWCPGQGAQHKEMFKSACRDEAIAAEVRGWLAGVLVGCTLEEVLADPVLLFDNRIAQPLITAATLAAWDALRTDLPTPDLIAGYSVGEVAACSVAGALPPTDAVRVAAERARLMQACANPPGTISFEAAAESAAGRSVGPGSPATAGDGEPAQAMLSIGGLPLATVETLARQFNLHVAIITGDDTFIVGGLRRQALLLEAEVRRHGARASVLPIGVASHTPLMTQAVAGFAKTLSQSSLTDPVVPFLAGLSAEIASTAAAVKHALTMQLIHPIQWAACMDACAERGVTVVLELGPGSALARMMQTRHPQIACRSIADFRSLEGVRRWVDRQFNQNG